MKIKHLFLSLGLAGALGFGVFAGLSMKGQVKEAKAVDYSGSIIVQKNDNDMKYTGSKLVAYFFDSDSHNGWGPAVANTGNKYQQYSWTLDFEPTTIIMLRVDSEKWDSADPWKEIFCRTGNVTLGDDILWMNGNSNESSGHGTFSLDAAVKGGATDSWTEATVQVPLDHVKTNGNIIEAYAEVNLPANTYFKVLKAGSTWCGNYTAHSSIASNLTGGGESNIHNTAAATYEFYFDYENLTTYITDPVLAAADEWAQDFLEGGCSATMADWDDHGTEFKKLSAESKALFTAIASGGNEDGSYIEQAVARYDLVEIRYGKTAYEEFMGREAAGKLNPKASNMISRLTDQPTFSILAVVVISSTIVLAVGGLFLLKKKRESK